MYSLRFTNIKGPYCPTFKTVGEAIKVGERYGFGFSVWDESGNCAASWTVFGGLS